MTAFFGHDVGFWLFDRTYGPPACHPEPEAIRAGMSRPFFEDLPGRQDVACIDVSS
jgi:hypothetical protein